MRRRGLGRHVLLVGHAGLELLDAPAHDLRQGRDHGGHQLLLAARREGHLEGLLAARLGDLLEQEKEKSDALKKELLEMREEMKKGWEAQDEFNRRLEISVKERKGKLARFFSLFGK